MTHSIRVILADDHQVVRSGIRNELQKYSDIEVVGEATDGLEALELVRRLQPDVLLLDINMPKSQGIDVAERIHKQQEKQPHILVLSAYCDREYVSAVFAVGAKGYLLKDEPLHRILKGIRQVAAGEPALSLSVQMALLSREKPMQHDLSVRELEVLKLIAKGYTNDEIASTLVIAEGTVKNHVSNIYRKLPEVHTRSEAVAWAWQNQIVQV